VAGQPATVQVTIRNQGQTDVPFGNNFYVDFYVDRVPTLNLPGDLQWGVQGGDMEAGTLKTFSGQVTFAGGAHGVYAQVDTDGFVSEANENNNIYGCVSVNTSGNFQAPRTTPEPLLPTVPRSTPTVMPAFLPTKPENTVIEPSINMQRPSLSSHPTSTP
jgi:hypothetical protein